MIFRLFFSLLLSTLFTTNLFANVVVSQESTAQTAQEKVIPFIELSAIPEEAVKSSSELNKMNDILQEGSDSIEIHEILPSYIAAIDVLLEDKVYQDLERLSIREIQKLRQSWLVYKVELDKYESTLKSDVLILEELHERLEKLSALWVETQIQAVGSDAPKSILSYVEDVIIEIETLKSAIKALYDQLLTDNAKVGTRIAQVQETMLKLKEIEVLLSERVFYQNQQPLGTLIFEADLNPLGYVMSIAKNIDEKFNEFLIYYDTHTHQQLLFLFAISMIIVFIGYFFYLYQKRELFVDPISRTDTHFAFITRPISTAIILIVLANVIVFTDAPKSLNEIIMFIILIPILRIMKSVVPSSFDRYFYLYFVIYLLSMLERNAQGFDLDDRLWSLGITLAFIVLIVKVIKDDALVFIKNMMVRKIIYRSLPIFIALLGISIISNLYGAVLLSEKITQGIFTTVHASLIFFVLTIILSGYVVVSLRRHLSSASHMKEFYADKVQRYTTMAIKIIMVIWWFKVLFRVVGLDHVVYPIVLELLEDEISIGSASFSFLALLSFLSILVGTWLIAKAVHIFYEVEIFGRFEFARGVPTAIDTTTRYIILISGVLIAFSSLGISTEQFAIVFGALGVGIGFGLRNIIANFVSGIIMVFERPVQIGDTIDVDGTMGKVLSIGTRASYVKTFDGSEVIIPNEQFISSKVINWTLSDEQRRKTIDVKVAFGSDIEKVLEIMQGVAESHDNVIGDPAPMATFVGFGDYYLEFKVYFWLTENLIKARSDIAIGIYKELERADIAMPTPLQEYIKHS